MTKEKVKKIVQNAPEVQPEPPRPLMRELPPADPFPEGALGGLLGDAAKAINDKTQAPMAICGQSVLAAATLAVQAYANVQLPTGHVKPLSCFFLTIAESGERKSAADDEALAPIRVQERNLRERHDADLLNYNNKKDVWDKSRKDILKGTKDDKIHEAK